MLLLEDCVELYLQLNFSLSAKLNFNLCTISMPEVTGTKKIQLGKSNNKMYSTAEAKPASKLCRFGSIFYIFFTMNCTVILGWFSRKLLGQEKVVHNNHPPQPDSFRIINSRDLLYCSFSFFIQKHEANNIFWKCTNLFWLLHYIIIP